MMKTRILCAMVCLVSGGLMAEDTPQAAAKQPEPPAMKELAPNVYEIGKLRLDKNTNMVTFPGILNMTEGPLEYMIVTPQGSVHESLLVTEVQPADLHFAMLLMGAKGAGLTTPGAGDRPPAQIDAEYLKRAPKLKGDSVNILIKYKDGDNGEKSVPIEDWLLNTDTKKPAPRGPWIYTGSMFGADERFLAQTDGLFVAVITNPSALINNPRKGNDNDQIWVVNKEAVPAAKTPVEIQIKIDTSTEPAAEPKRSPSDK